ncbi:MAG: hypothetical protein ACUZ8I_05135 [Candidatus Scalindua sp.]
MATEDKIYRFHVANLRSIEIALNNTALSARQAISEENQPATASFIRLYALLIGVWAEARLRKLLYERSGFTEDERKRVLTQTSQLEQWQKLVEVAFRKHYGIPQAQLTSNSLPFTAHARYASLVNILDNYLRVVIEVRNKLAHGQWIYPLNNEGNDVEPNKYTLLNKENLPSLQYKKSLLSSLADIVHNLVVSLPTFERDFDSNYSRITNTKNNLINRNYEKYVAMLIDKRQRGIKKHKANMT